MYDFQIVPDISKVASIWKTSEKCPISPGINFITSIDARPKGTYVSWGFWFIFSFIF